MVRVVLEDYIRKSLNQGKDTESIKSALLQTGWNSSEVDQALKELVVSKPVSGRSSLTQPKSGEVVQQVSSQELGGKEASRFSRVYRYFHDIYSGERKFKSILAALGLAILSSIYPAYKIISVGLPFIENLDQRVMSTIDEVFPEDLEIKIQDGEASTNVTEPYFLTISQSTLNELANMQESASQPHSKIRLLTINTGGRVEDFERYQSLAMLTGSTFVYYDEGEITIRSLNTAPDMTVSKEVIVSKINEINKGNRILSLIRTFLFLSPLITILGLWIWHLLEIFLGALIVLIITRIHQLKISFKQMFAFSGAIYFLPAIVLMLIRLLPGVNSYYFWFKTVTDIFLIVVTYLFILRYKNQTVES